MTMGTISNAVEQRPQNRPPNLVQIVQRMQPEIERALPKHLNADRMARLALTVIRQSEMAKQKGIAKASLSDCDPASFAGSLLTAAALGLEPGVNGEAYLVPYKRECQLIIGYQGMVKLFWQHPMAKHIDAQAVHEHDDFDYEYGLDPYLRHKPATGDRGKVTHYYAAASLTSGAKTFVVLTADEVRLLRRGKVGSSGDIPDPQHWMERKTALRQLLKMLPKSTQLLNALTVDEQNGSDLAASKVPEAIADRNDPVQAPAIEPGPQQDGERIDTATGEVLEPPAYDQEPPPEDDREPATPDTPPAEQGDGWPPARQPGRARR